MSTNVINSTMLYLHGAIDERHFILYRAASVFCKTSIDSNVGYFDCKMFPYVIVKGVSKRSAGGNDISKCIP